MTQRTRKSCGSFEFLAFEILNHPIPRLPGKWPFGLTEHQLDSRRRGLESYLERTCSIRVIVDHPAMREFLTDNDSENSALSQVNMVKVCTYT